MAFVLAACGDPKSPVGEPWSLDAQSVRVVVESGPDYSKKTIWNDFATCFWSGGCPTRYWGWELRLIPLTPERAWHQTQELYSAQFSEIEEFQRDGLQPPYSLRSLELSETTLEEQNQGLSYQNEDWFLKDARERAAREARYIACAEAVMQRPQETKAQWHARLMKSQAGGVAYLAGHSINAYQAENAAHENPKRRGRSYLTPVLDDACPEGS